MRAPSSNTSASLVSVIVPAFNSALHIERCLASIRDQSLRPIELFVVDDASTDNTAQVVGQWATHLTNLRLLSLDENAGPADARNLGIAQATGEWIAFLDADDVWHGDHLLSLLETASAFPKADLIFGSASDQHEERPSEIGKPFEISSLVNVLLRKNLVLQSAVMVRRSVLVAAGAYRAGARYAEDFDLWLRLAAAGISFAWSGRETCARGHHADQVSVQFPLRMINSAWCAREDFVRNSRVPIDSALSSALKAAIEVDLEAAWSFRSRDAIREVISRTQWVPDAEAIVSPWVRRVSWQWPLWYAAVSLYDRLPTQLKRARNFVTVRRRKI
jgi:glycosyltransferase involved in cell wall biosynthesis